MSRGMYLLSTRITTMNGSILPGATPRADWPRQYNCAPAFYMGRMVLRRALLGHDVIGCVRGWSLLLLWVCSTSRAWPCRSVLRRRIAACAQELRQGWRLGWRSVFLASTRAGPRSLAITEVLPPHSPSGKEYKASHLRPSFFPPPLLWQGTQSVIQGVTPDVTPDRKLLSACASHSTSHVRDVLHTFWSKSKDQPLTQPITPSPGALLRTILPINAGAHLYYLGQSARGVAQGRILPLLYSYCWADSLAQYTAVLYYYYS